MKQVEHAVTETFDFSSILQEYRETARLTQIELAKRLDVTRNSVFNWENHLSVPDVYMAGRICRELHIPMNAFTNVFSEINPIRGDEKKIIHAYRALSESGKQFALQIMISMQKEDYRQQCQQLKDEYMVLTKQHTRAAAGTGCMPTDDITPEYCFVQRNKTSIKADTIITVSGQSMEPKYKDGDQLYMIYTAESHPGEDIVCSTTDGIVIKRKGKDQQLHSLNPKLPYLPKFEDDQVTTIGKIIGIVQPEDKAPKSKEQELEEVFASEISKLTQSSK